MRPEAPKNAKKRALDELGLDPGNLSSQTQAPRPALCPIPIISRPQAPGPPAGASARSGKKPSETKYLLSGTPLAGPGPPEQPDRGASGLRPDSPPAAVSKDTGTCPTRRPGPPERALAARGQADPGSAPARAEPGAIHRSPVQPPTQPVAVHAAHLIPPSGPGQVRQGLPPRHSRPHY